MPGCLWTRAHVGACVFIFDLLHVQTDTRTCRPPRHSSRFQNPECLFSVTNSESQLTCVCRAGELRHIFPHEPCVCADCVICPASLNLKPRFFWREQGGGRNLTTSSGKLRRAGCLCACLQAQTRIYLPLDWKGSFLT